MPELSITLYWAMAMLPVNLFNLLLYDDLCRWLLQPDLGRREGWPFACVAASVVMTAIDLLPAPWWVNVLFTAAILVILTIWFYERGQRKRSLFFAGLFLLLISFSDTMGQNGYLLVEPSAQGWPGPLRRMAGTFVCLLIIFTLVKLYIRVAVHIYREISIFWFLTFLIIPMACLICCLFISHLMINYPVTGQEELALTLTGSALLFACWAAFSLFESMVQHMEVSREFQYIRLRREMEKTHYEIIQQKNDDHAGMVHDIKHHLRYLSQLAASEDWEELKRFLQILQQDFSSRTQGVYTDDKILNVILCEKAAQAHQQKIDFQVELTAGISFLNPMDACTLMGNLLDNALEGAASAPGKKFIRLQIRPFNNTFVIVRVENSFSGELKSRGRRLLSTKPQGHHGYGMKSIEQIAERTGGSMEYIVQDEIFQTTVLLNTILPTEE